MNAVLECWHLLKEYAVDVTAAEPQALYETQEKSSHAYDAFSSNVFSFLSIRKIITYL